MAEVNYDHKGDYKDPFIITATGGRFYPARPYFDIQDIAHALCLNTRYNGHIKYPYSVGQHSILVMLIARMLRRDEGGDATHIEMLEALLHDATEAYLTDVPAPLKQLLPDWKALDKRLDSLMRKQFGLPQEKSPLIAKADWYALFIESRELLPQGAYLEFEDPLNIRDEVHDFALRHGFYKELAPSVLSLDKDAFMGAYDYIAYCTAYPNKNFIGLVPSDPVRIAQ